MHVAHIARSDESHLASRFHGETLLSLKCSWHWVFVGIALYFEHLFGVHPRAAQRILLSGVSRRKRGGRMRRSSPAANDLAAAIVLTHDVLAQRNSRAFLEGDSFLGNEQVDLLLFALARS